MERDRGFKLINFKLLVPPRLTGQVSTVKPVKPQESFEDMCGYRPFVQEQGYNKYFEKASSMPFPNAKVVPMKPTRADVGLSRMTVVPEDEEEEETICKPSQLCSKLYDEVEKVKCWKVKVDSEAVQKDRKLQENKRTIETQRKAIQELQFGNESLSIKLEEQIGDNADLRNKMNATRNLCNILKDTFQRSAEKINLCESEREETHQLYMENSENIQRMINAFEGLRVQDETNRHEMQKVKEGLQQFEELKETFEKEYSMKQKEIVILQVKIRDKENELQEILLNLHETQESFKQLQETANQQHEVLQSSKQEQESLFEELQRAEQLNKDTEEGRKAIAAALELNKEEYATVLIQKDASLDELNKIKDLQKDKLLEIQATAQELQTSLTLEIEKAKELELKVTSITNDLYRKNSELEELKEQKENKDRQLQILEDELDVKSKYILSQEEKIEEVNNRTLELTYDLAEISKKVQQFKIKMEIRSVENNSLEKALKKAEDTHNDLKEKALVTESKVQEVEGQLSVALRKDETSIKEIEKLKKDIAQHEMKHEELSIRFNQLQLEKKIIVEQIKNQSSETKIIEAHLKEIETKEMTITKETERLEEENHQLREEVKSLNTNIKEQGQDTENLEKKLEESCEELQAELTKKEKHIKSVETKLSILKTKLEGKTKSHDECQKEIKMLKKQRVKEVEKSSQLENEIHRLKEESNNIQQLNDEECQKLIDDLGTKSTSEAELQKEVQQWKVTAVEAIKCKGDAEIKCQHKIADMVALMEKHKNQYDKMVEEKDAELVGKKRKETEVDAIRTSLELDLSQKNIETKSLKEQLKQLKKECENLQQEITELQIKDMASLQMSQQLEKQSKQLLESNSKRIKYSETPKVAVSKRPGFDFSKTKQKTVTPTPSQSSNKRVSSTPDINETENKALKTPSRSSTNRVGLTPLQNKENENEGLKTPSWNTNSIHNRVGETPRIKSYRIRTPPSTEKALWRRSTLELDPKSDSSEQNDLLSFAGAAEPFKSSLQPSVPAVKHPKLDMFKKIPSPAFQKSPGALKLAAMKRMRDAGWTAVTGTDKKKKKDTGKIFA